MEEENIMKVWHVQRLLLIILLLFLGVYKKDLYGNDQGKLKLLFFLRHPSDIGARAFIRDQIAGFIERGHDVWITYYEKKYLNTTSFKLSVAFIEKNKLSEKFFYYNTILNQSKDYRTYDVIICHSGSDYAHHVLNLLKQKKLFGQLVAFFRGWDLIWRIKENVAKYAQLFREGDLFLSVCEYLKGYAIRLGCPAEKILIQRSGINCEKFKYKDHSFSSDSQINLITVSGGGGIRKGVAYMVQAAAHIIKKYPNVKFIIVGRHEAQRLIKKLPAPVSNNIIDLGWQAHDKLPEILEQAHIFMAASITDTQGRQEGIPTALKEAMACGLPVVSTFHAGIPELIEEGESGLLVNERDVKGLAEKIEYLINNPELCLKMGQEARRVIEIEHNISIENDNFEKIILNLVGNS